MGTAPYVTLDVIVLVVAAALGGCASDPPRAVSMAMLASTDPSIVDRGRYLVHGPAHCSSCHSDVMRAATAPPMADSVLAGGRRFELGILGTFVAANLTSDATTGIGAWSDGELFAVLRTGRNRSGRPLAPLMDTVGMSDDDLMAIISYLRRLPPVSMPQERAPISLIGAFVLSAVFGQPLHDSPPPPSSSGLRDIQLGA